MTSAGARRERPLPPAEGRRRPRSGRVLRSKLVEHGGAHNGLGATEGDRRGIAGCGAGVRGRTHPETRAHPARRTITGLLSSAQTPPENRRTRADEAPGNAQIADT